jgi:predicted nucleic acid-binding Zn ribbon protein
MAGSKKKPSNIEGINEILGRLKEQSLLGKQLELSLIWEQWEQIAGPALSKHGTPYAVDEGQLRVRVDSPVWMHKYAYHKWRIIKEINRRARKELISDLFVTLLPEDEELLP